jgi:ariadne-1
VQARLPLPVRRGDAPAGVVQDGSRMLVWAGKNGPDGMTTHWVQANTKKCPNCQRVIEKNQGGCNHMRCGAPCLHQFCWLCLGSWANHSGTNYQLRRGGGGGGGGERWQVGVRQGGEAAGASQGVSGEVPAVLHYYESWSIGARRVDEEGAAGPGRPG